MKIRFLLILLLSVGLAACAAVGAQPSALSGTPAGLNNFLSQTKPAGQTDLVGQTASPVQPGTSNQAALTTEQPETTESTNEAVTTEQPEATESTGQAETNQQAEPTKAEAASGENNTPVAVIPATGGQLSYGQLSDYHVVDSTGIELGDVKDAVVRLGGAGSNVGQVPYLVVESSTLKDWNVPVPWQKVQIRTDTQTVVLPVTAAQFASAPGFNKDVWPSSFNNQSALQNYWANPGQAAAGQPASLGTTAAQAVDYIRAHDLTDLKVINPQGVKLGKIEDLAINWQNSQNGASAAQFGYVIMQLDESISQAEVQVPVPWRLVHPTPGAENLVLNIAANVLQSAPNFMKGAMPNLYAEPANGTLNQFWANK